MRARKKLGVCIVIMLIKVIKKIIETIIVAIVILRIIVNIFYGRKYNENTYSRRQEGCKKGVGAIGCV